MNLRMMWRKNWPDVVAATCGGVPSFVFAAEPYELVDGVPVFCYHAAHPSVIDADMRFLADNGYVTWTAEDLFACMRGGEQWSPADKAVVLTVDDGAADLYSVLYPALKKYGFCAVAFIAPAFHQDRYDLPDNLRPCTWGELIEMQESGVIDIQSHTATHRYVPNWPEPLDLVGIDRDYSRRVQAQRFVSLQSDLAEAKTVLESKLCKSINHLAFPMYRGTSAAMDTACTLGYAGFWWGTLAGRRANRPHDPCTQIVRIDARYLRRLPGSGRVSLSATLGGRATISR